MSLMLEWRLLEKNMLPDGIPELSEQSIVMNRQSYHASCVYFLISNMSIVYVGKSTRGLQRLHEHIERKNWEKEFDSYFYTPIPNDKLTAVELFYICKFAPKYNKRTSRANWKNIHPTADEVLRTLRISEVA